MSEFNLICFIYEISHFRVNNPRENIPKERLDWRRQQTLPICLLTEKPVRGIEAHSTNHLLAIQFKPALAKW